MLPRDTGKGGCLVAVAQMCSTDCKETNVAQAQ